MKRLSFLCLLCAALLAGQPLWAQKPASASKENASKENASKENAPAASKAIPTIDAFLKGLAPTSVGMTPVWEQDGKFYLSLADSLIGRDLLMVSRIAESPAGFRSNFFGYAGDQLSSGMFRFEKGPRDQIFLTKVLSREQAPDSTQSMYANVLRSNRPAIVQEFAVKAYNADSTVALIEVTDFVKNDHESLYFSKAQKKAAKMGAFQAGKSYVESIKSFPINTELRSVKTFAPQEGGDNMTFSLNCSLVLLPKEPMQPRFEDERVGYFTHRYTHFNQNPQGIKNVSMIARWRLEPKPEDLEKYRRGELVEPAKPIVYYIDPTTPKEWVPYLIQGVNDWQVVFEKAGFKNAIYAVEAPTPEEDPTWSLEDARNSAIVYKPSTIANASGPHVSDPRSGEIIESHINWYHNVMSLVHNWYMVQCAVVDPQARSMVFPEELMGQLIRFVSSHEVGHTLGLRHNFGATAYYTTAQLRDPEFLRLNGHTTSIMDYSRFNFVVQPEDNVPRELLFPRISHYDYWAIEWGYRRFYEFANAQEEVPFLSQWVTEKTQNPYLRFNGGSEKGYVDPRAQSEDLGDNQMETCELGIKNLKVLMENLPQWTRMPNEDFSSLGTMYLQVVSQYGRYIGHVAKWVGGVYTNPKKVEEAGEVWTPVEKARQEEAMAFLNRHLFTTPQWLVPSYAFSLLNYSTLSIMENQQKAGINALIGEQQLQRMLRNETAPGYQSYTIEALFSDLNRYIFAQSGANDPYRRSLQKVYVHALLNLAAPQRQATTAAQQALRGGAAASENSEVRSIARYQADQLTQQLAKASKGDPRTRSHYQYLIYTINERLYPNGK